MEKSKIKILIITGICGLLAAGITLSVIGSLAKKEPKEKTVQSLITNKEKAKPVPSQDADGVKTSGKVIDEEKLNLYEKFYYDSFTKIEMPKLIDYPKDNLNYIYFLNLQAIQEETYAYIEKLADGTASITDYSALIDTIDLNIKTCIVDLKELDTSNKGINSSDRTATALVKAYQDYINLLNKQKPLIAKMQSDPTITNDFFVQSYSSDILNFKQNLTNLMAELNLVQVDNNKVNDFKDKIRQSLLQDLKYNN